MPTARDVSPAGEREAEGLAVTIRFNPEDATLIRAAVQRFRDADLTMTVHRLAKDGVRRHAAAIARGGPVLEPTIHAA